MSDIIQTIEGQIGFVVETTDDRFQLSVPITEGTNKIIWLDKSDVDCSGALWKQRIPYRKINS